MPVQQSFLDLFNFSDLSTFTHNIPIEWIESARHTQARKRLGAEPAECLFRRTAQHGGQECHPVDRKATPLK